MQKKNQVSEMFSFIRNCFASNVQTAVTNSMLAYHLISLRGVQRLCERV